MVKSVLTIVKSAPYGREDAFAGLRFSLSQIAAGMLDACGTLLIEDGVYNVKLGQDTAPIRMPSNLDATQDIMDLDGRVYCVREHLEERGIPLDDILDEVDIISLADVAEIAERYDAFATY